MTALQKKTGGVGGIVTGEVSRRLVASSIAQQLAYAVEVATSPFASSTKANGECVAHTIQTLTDWTVATVLHRRYWRVRSFPVGISGWPPPVCAPDLRNTLWEDDDGSVHVIHQGEEQSDPLMPMPPSGVALHLLPDPGGSSIIVSIDSFSTTCSARLTSLDNSCLGVSMCTTSAPRARNEHDSE